MQQVRDALTRDRARVAVEYAVVGGAYIGAAKFGLHLSVAHGVITPVWPPAGIAIAALVLRGPKLWPAIAIGALVSNATSGVSIGVATAIAFGNTLEAVAGWYLLRRANFRPSLDRARDVLALAVLAGFVSTALAATNGVTTLRIAGSPNAAHFGSAWSLWWLGDAMGVLLVAPVLLVWATRPWRMPGRARIVEAAATAGILGGTGAAVFLGGLWRYPYPIFPLLVMATLRFRQLGAATGCFIIVATAVAGAVSGQTPLGNSPTTAVQILQGLLAFIAISLLVLGATLTERNEAERGFRQTAEQLTEAQQLAQLGSWEWDVASDRVTWSDELYRIYGVKPGAKLDYGSFLEHVHPEDRELVRGVVERAFAEGGAFEMAHRVVLDDGSVRRLIGRGRVVVGDDGKPARMVGTGQDVTDRYAAETLRESILSTVSHELRTPLTSILGFAMTLRERGNSIDETIRRDLTEQLTRQAVRLERLLSDLLDVDRLRHGLVRAQREPTDVAMLVTRVAAATGHPVEIEADPVVAEVDRPKLERIVENLIVNAIKHTPAGTEITAGVEADGSDLLLRIDDRGPGIPAADKLEIFDLFARGNGPDGAHGTGIGLALVTQFVHLHGGSVWVEDRAGGGASFRVRLPECVVGTVLP
jgi:PAS domain S-box-containing protein